MHIPNIAIPYSLITNNMEHKKYLLMTYIYLYLRRGIDGLLYTQLSTIMKDGCGYSVGGYPNRVATLCQELAEVIKFLQDNNYIGDVIDQETGEIIDVTIAAPEQNLIFDLSRFQEKLTEKFEMISFDDYRKIKTLNNRIAWKALAIYLYLGFDMFYVPGKPIDKSKYWLTTYEKMSKIFQDGYTKPTVSNVYNKLQELGLISYRTVYCETGNQKGRPRCIGQVIIINDSSSSDEINKRLYQAYYWAKHKFLEHRKNIRLEDAAFAYAEKGA